MAQLYIANIGKYNEGFLVGDWIQLPFEEDEFHEFLAEKVGINAEYEEFAIHDTDDIPFEVHEFDNVLGVNEKYEQYEQAVLEHGEDIVNGLIGYFGFEDGMAIVENYEYMYHAGAMNMTDVAYAVVDEFGFPNNMEFYFDFEQFKYDLDIEGFFDEYVEDPYNDMLDEDEKDAIVQELLDSGCVGEDNMETYFDYAGFGQDLEINGTFIEGDEGYIEVLY